MRAASCGIPSSLSSSASRPISPLLPLWPPQMQAAWAVPSLPGEQLRGVVSVPVLPGTVRLHFFGHAGDYASGQSLPGSGAGRFHRRHRTDVRVQQQPHVPARFQKTKRHTAVRLSWQFRHGKEIVHLFTGSFPYVTILRKNLLRDREFRNIPCRKYAP